MNSKKGLNKILLYLGSPVVRVFLFIFNGIKDLQCKLQSKHIDIRALLTLCIPSGFEQYSIAISNGPSATGRTNSDRLKVRTTKFATAESSIFSTIIFFTRENMYQFTRIQSIAPMLLSSQVIPDLWVLHIKLASCQPFWLL